MSTQKNQKKGSSRKCGRNKRATDVSTSKYVRGSISFEQYRKEKGF